MSPKEAYKHCIRCGSTLSDKETFLQCITCGFKQFLNPIPANGVIIENDKGEILLVKRKGNPQKGFWDVPGGFIDINESLEHSVQREIREELNIEIQMTGIIGVYEDTYLYQEINLTTLAVIVSAKIISGTMKSSDDIDGFRYFSKDEVLKQQIAFAGVRKGIEDYLKTKNKPYSSLSVGGIS
jgi:ADP-ribose pyrophosphatase YjhB (NUDIX family)